ncbi:MAG: hypothetical protein WAL22_16680, partial [Solirubrobacteraceae bacterium]
MSVLLVCGGVEMEQSVYEQEARGYWSAALPCALEKHGIPFTQIRPQGLADPEAFIGHEVVLLARQPVGSWNEALVQHLDELPGGAIVEGPVPWVFAERLGVVDQGSAEPIGAMQVIDADLRSAGAAYGVSPGGQFNMGSSRPVTLDVAQRWPATSAPISEKQALAWRARGWDARRWAVTSAETTVLADWIAAGLGNERLPGIVQRGGLVGASVGIFAFVGQSHTSEPYDGGIHRTWPRTDSVEALLLGLIDLLYARAGRPRVRVLPWPAGFNWSMHVRHDVDRPLNAQDAAKTAARHVSLGTKATW